MELVNKVKALFKGKTADEKDKEIERLNYLLEAGKTTILAFEEAFGLLYKKLQDYKDEAMIAFGAIALQHGGEIKVGKEYFDIVKSNGDARLTMEVDKEGSLILKVVIEKATNEPK